MPPPIAPAQPWSALQIYRHLLREASYLPPACRTQIESRIRNRFRKHRRDPAPEPRIQTARHEFRNLRAANLGGTDRMYRVMLLTFGRSGWRRRALFTDMRQVEQPATSDALRQALQDQDAPASGDWLGQWDTKKLTVFIKSQLSHSPRNSPWPKITAAKLDPASVIPETNIWGKPLHDKVKRTKEMSWWKKCAHRILPPLPRSEWELLKRLALGTAGPDWDVPVRRTSSAPIIIEEEFSATAWNWQKHAIMPIRDIERPNSRRLRLYYGITSELGQSIPGGPATGVHRYTPRFWRRMYGSIWQMTPMMEKTTDGSKGGWNITWGGAPIDLAPATPAHSELFEGVDESHGNLLEGSGRKPKKKKREQPSDGGKKQENKEKQGSQGKHEHGRHSFGNDQAK